MSATSEEVEQKKRSQKIDKDLEEDSKRLRRECKILLLGVLPSPSRCPYPILRAASGAASREPLDVCANRVLRQAPARAESPQ